jgi:hypothetical protein
MPHRIKILSRESATSLEAAFSRKLKLAERNLGIPSCAYRRYLEQV